MLRPLVAVALASFVLHATRAGADDDVPRSLSLAAAVALALDHAPALVSARAHVAEARGALTGVVLDNPSASLGGGLRLRPEGVVVDVDVALSQQIDLGLPLFARSRARSAEVDAAGAAVDDVVRIVSSSVAEAFIEAVSARQREQLLREGSLGSARLLESVEARRRVGDVSDLDTATARAAAATDAARFRTAVADADRAESLLRALLGIEPETPLALRADDAPLPATSVLLQALEQRADLRTLQALERAADADVDAAAAQAWPALQIGAGYSHDDGDEMVVGSLGVSLPVFDRGQGEASSSLARRDGLRLERAALLRAGRTELVGAVTAHALRVEVLTNFDRDGVVAAGTALALTEQAFAGGEVPLSVVLVARSVALEARGERVSLFALVLRARARVAFLAGVSP